MQREEPLVSVLIPCYNHEKFVKDCLDSILAQDYPSYEVVLCDDASKDDSVRMVREAKPLFDEREIRFVFLEHKENQGFTKTLNCTLREAKGKYVKIISSDDMMKPDYMKEMVKLLEDNAHLKFAFCNCTRVREQAGYPVEEEFLMTDLLEEIPDCKNNVAERIYVDNFIPAPSLLYRREILEEVGGYDEKIGIEDLEMSLRILQKYPQGAGCLQKSLIYYRVNENSMSSAAKTKGGLKRTYYMLSNSVAIAKKYKHHVSKKAYRERMKRLYKNYVMQMLGMLRGMLMGR